MPAPALRTVPAVSVDAAGVQSGTHRTLPEETPVAMVFDGTTTAVMMATPGDLDDFAMGFALTEGFITGPRDVERFEAIHHEQGTEARFWLAEPQRQALAARRRRMLGPVGCGLCGIDSLDEALRPLPVLPKGGGLHSTDVITAPDRLLGHQPLQDRTRGVHAAGFLSPGKGIILTREDVGRHNALDKLIGAMMRQGIDAKGGAIMLTSRVSIEMVQKTVICGCPVLIAVSAPTAHAVRLAEDAGLTLAAFVRDGGFDIFSHPHRIRTGGRDAG